jgi:molybdopterin-guanine dinucleotide biosynthesis protein A
MTDQDARSPGGVPAVPEETPVSIAGVILAGGESRRMGRTKGLLPIGSATLIETVLARVREACGIVLLVTNTPEMYRQLEIPMVSDALPDRRSLVGIYTGLLRVDGPAFVCACDMPFLNPALIRHLGTLLRGVDAVIPRHGGEYEPLHAVYTPACLDPIRRCLARGDRNTGFLRDVRVRVVEGDEIRRFDPDLRSFININTPEDYARIQRMVTERRSSV